ncbi:hypothetical protein JOF48_000937 [Arthrobacter stackebrandtii]|uniref:ABC transporter ATP-binding protein n=1 Tax=Arthrobacter stackebrandtii TaxID=272161 RepID=A0ABS4YW15_9MICC|nr:ABC transporter ATP-binding protein [Arthrobacter stackebrandtii]MBP2412138.1 hypothetical protein [Arthrobacter stackebrandtii]
MLSTNQLHIIGRRHTLLPATTVEAHKGEVLLIQADGQERRTALSLALTGRMKPSSGTVALGRDASMAALRRRSTIVDAPDVNAPEHHLTVHSLASEDLALVPYKFRDRTRPTEWLVTRGFRDLLGKWVEELEPARLLHLQLELALADHGVELVVVDSPDRHSADAGTWLPLLELAAAGRMGLGPEATAQTPPRPLLVVGVVGRLPDGWEGPSAVAGNADHPVAHPSAQSAAQSDGTQNPAPADELVEASDAEEAAIANVPAGVNGPAEGDKPAAVADAAEAKDPASADGTAPDTGAAGAVAGEAGDPPAAPADAGGEPAPPAAPAAPAAPAESTAEAGMAAQPGPADVELSDAEHQGIQKDKQ